MADLTPDQIQAVEEIQNLIALRRRTGKKFSPAMEARLAEAEKKGLLFVPKRKAAPAPLPGDPTLRKPIQGTPMKRGAYPIMERTDTGVFEEEYKPLERSDNAKNKSALGFLRNVWDDLPRTIGESAAGMLAIPSAIIGAPINGLQSALVARKALEDYKKTRDPALISEFYENIDKSKASLRVPGEMATDLLGMGKEGIITKIRTAQAMRNESENKELPASVRLEAKRNAERLLSEVWQGVKDQTYERPVLQGLNATMGVGTPGKTAALMKVSQASKNVARIEALLNANKNNPQLRRKYGAELNTAKAGLAKAKYQSNRITSIENNVNSFGIPKIVGAVDSALSKKPSYVSAKARATAALNKPIGAGALNKARANVAKAEMDMEFQDMADAPWQLQQRYRAATEGIQQDIQALSRRAKLKKGNADQPVPDVLPEPTNPPIEATNPPDVLPPAKAVEVPPVEATPPASAVLPDSPPVRIEGDGAIVPDDLYSRYKKHMDDNGKGIEFWDDNPTPDEVRYSLQKRYREEVTSRLDAESHAKARAAEKALEDPSVATDEGLLSAAEHFGLIAKNSAPKLGKNVAGGLVTLDELPEHKNNLANLQAIKDEIAKRGLGSPVEAPAVEPPVGGLAEVKKRTSKPKATAEVTPAEDPRLTEFRNIYAGQETGMLQRARDGFADSPGAAPLVAIIEAELAKRGVPLENPVAVAVPDAPVPAPEPVSVRPPVAEASPQAPPESTPYYMGNAEGNLPDDPPATPTSPLAQKEPWQMTRKEWDEYTIVIPTKRGRIGQRGGGPVSDLLDDESPAYRDGLSRLRAELQKAHQEAGVEYTENAVRQVLDLSDGVNIFEGSLPTGKRIIIVPENATNKGIGDIRKAEVESAISRGEIVPVAVKADVQGSGPPPVTPSLDELAARVLYKSPGSVEKMGRDYIPDLPASAYATDAPTGQKTPLRIAQEMGFTPEQAAALENRVFSMMVEAAKSAGRRTARPADIKAWVADRFPGIDQPSSGTVPPNGEGLKPAVATGEAGIGAQGQGAEGSPQVPDAGLIGGAEPLANDNGNGGQAGQVQGSGGASVNPAVGGFGGLAAIIPLDFSNPIVGSLMTVTGIAGLGLLFAARQHLKGGLTKLKNKLETDSSAAVKLDTYLSQYVEAVLPREIEAQLNPTLLEDGTPAPIDPATAQEIAEARANIVRMVEQDLELRPEKGVPADQAASVAEEFIQMGDRIAQTFEALGQELVDVGLINEKAYAANKGRYLRRIYQMWEDPEGYLGELEKRLTSEGASKEMVGVALSRERQLFKSMTGRSADGVQMTGTSPSGRTSKAKLAARKLNEQDMELRDFLGEIGLSSIRSRRGGEIASREISKAVLSQSVADKFSVTSKRAMEIDQMPDSRKKGTAPPDDSVFRNPAERLYYYHRELFEQVQQEDNLKGLGHLEGDTFYGSHIPATILKELTQGEYQPTTAFQKYMMAWKLSKTAMNPSSWAGNVFGNILLSYLGGGMKALNPENYARASKSMRERDAYFTAAMEHSDHPFESLRMEITTREHLDPKIIYPSTLKNRLKQAAKKGKDNITNLYGGIDTVFKHALFMDTMDRLADIDPRMKIDQRAKIAARQVAKTFPNFRHGTPIRLLRPAVKTLRRSQISPFVSWDASIIPLATMLLMEHPTRAALFPSMYQAYQKSIESWMESQPGGLEAYEEEKRALPDYMNSYIRLPMDREKSPSTGEENGAALYGDSKPFNPLTALYDVTENPLEAVMMRLGPIIQTIQAIHSNRKLGTDIPVYQEGDPFIDRFKDGAAYAAKQTIPYATQLMQLKANLTGRSETPREVDMGNGESKSTYDLDTGDRIRQAARLARVGVKRVDIPKELRGRAYGLQDSYKDYRKAGKAAQRAAEALRGRQLTEEEAEKVVAPSQKVLMNKARKVRGGD